MEEIPYQFLQLKDWKRLSGYLLDLERVILFNNEALLADFNDYWKHLAPYMDPVSGYTELMAKQEVAPSPKVLRVIASFFRYIGRYDASQEMALRHLSTSEAIGGEEGLKDMAVASTNLAWLFYKKRDFANAELYHHKAYVIHERIGSSASRLDLTNILESFGVIYRAKNELVKAEETHSKGNSHTLPFTKIFFCKLCRLSALLSLASSRAEETRARGVLGGSVVVPFEPRGGTEAAGEAPGG